MRSDIIVLQFVCCPIFERAAICAIATMVNVYASLIDRFEVYSDVTKKRTISQKTFLYTRY